MNNPFKYDKILILIVVCRKTKQVTGWQWTNILIIVSFLLWTARKVSVGFPNCHVNYSGKWVGERMLWQKVQVLRVKHFTISQYQLQYQYHNINVEYNTILPSLERLLPSTLASKFAKAGSTLFCFVYRLDILY